jgi:hypothetical protein
VTAGQGLNGPRSFNRSHIVKPPRRRRRCRRRRRRVSLIRPAALQTDDYCPSTFNHSQPAEPSHPSSQLCPAAEQGPNETPLANHNQHALPPSQFSRPMSMAQGPRNMPPSPNRDQRIPLSSQSNRPPPRTGQSVNGPRNSTYTQQIHNPSNLT